MPALIDRLAELIVGDNAVLFVGAGLRQGPDQPPAVQQIADALAARIDYGRPDRSLPAVARDFEVLRGRSALILALREELERRGADQPVAVYQLIADAVLPGTKIITTRFDRVLEQALEQFAKPYVLIVRETDLPFFDESKVALIKMQGDIGQPDSLVITEDDIDAFISKLPTISDVVRAFFATKTLVFLGYDLDDAQFKRFFRQVTRDLRSFRRQAYAIVPRPMDEVDVRYWRDQNVEIHVQDPLPFLERLAQAVRAAGQEPPPGPHPLAEVAAPPLPPRPYKGLDPFSGADQAIYPGRVEESHRLANRVLAHRLAVLYGESGSGKTSLLQAGAGPRLARDRALLAICAPAPGQPLTERLRDALLDAGRQVDLPDPGGEALPDIVRGWQRALDGPVVLAVDQFEQFFLAYDPQERRSAARALRALLDDRSLDLRLVLVVREDFLGRVQTLEEEIPGLLDVRFRLERLSREAARAAIEEPARLYDVTWDPALVETLLDDLYDSADGGVAPPQLQIVCDFLYGAAVEQGHQRITLAQFGDLGGTGAILGRYLDRAVHDFAPDRQPAVRRLLGALVSSSGAKQRLALDDLARAAEVDPPEAVALLDELTRLRLVRRYEVTAEGGDPAGVHYELAHDYMVPCIARWLGDDFWAAQKAREIVRQAVPEWRGRGRLLARDDLRLVVAQMGQVRFSAAEAELIYASAAGYDDCVSECQAPLEDADCRRVLLRLVEHPEPLVRGHAACALAAFSGQDAAAALAQAALADQAPAVREAAARAIARPHAPAAGADGAAPHREAVAHLAAAAADPVMAAAALQALVRVRDLQPASHELLPDDLRGPVRRRVWAARWRRHRHQILAHTLRGLQGGFWGLGLGMGLFLGPRDALASGFDRLSWRALVQLSSVGVPVAGVVGALSAGSAAFVSATLRHLADRGQRWRDWGVTTAVSAVTMGLSFVLFAYVFSGEPQPLRAMLAGLLGGLGLAGAATAPVGWPRLLRLGLAALAGAVAFVLAARLGLLFGGGSLWWPLLMGGASGIGFALGLNSEGQEVEG